MHASTARVALTLDFARCWCQYISNQQCVLCPWHAEPFEQPPTGAATSVLRAPSNTAILHEILADILLSSDSTQAQSYNSHFCSAAPCRRALAPSTRHRECSHDTQPARHSRDLKSSIADREPAGLTRAMWSQSVCVRAQNGQRSARSPAALVVACASKCRRLSGSLFHRRANQRPCILVAPQQRTA